MAYASLRNKRALTFMYDNGADIHHLLDGVLCDACKCGDLDMAKWLVEQGCDPHCSNSQPFLEAMVGHSVEVMEWIVGEGMDMSGSGAGRVFSDACEVGDLPMAKWLYEHGLDINKYYDWGAEIALMRHRREICDWLLKLAGEMELRWKSRREWGTVKGRNSRCARGWSEMADPWSNLEYLK